jgi:60S ribosomal subunit assembly/export protein LOC1
MAPSRTTTVKSKHAANKSGIRNSKNSSKPQSDGVSKQRKPPKSKAPPLKSSGGPVKKKKYRIYTEKELGVPALNMVTPLGVEKPKGKKKGKVFVDDQVYHSYSSSLPHPPTASKTLFKFSITDKTNPRYLGRNQ